MKVIVFTDTHANLPALQALVREIEREGYDEVFHTGDAIDIGPYPAECMETLLSIPRIQFIMGNHDAWFVNGLPRPRPNWMDQNEEQHCRWTASQLSADMRHLMSRWPYAYQSAFQGTTVTFVHYGLHENPSDYVPAIKNPTPGDLDRMLGRFRSDVVFYGHHHQASDIEGYGRYVNPGALGCCSEAAARYCIIRFQKGQYTLEHKTVPYDAGDLFREFEKRQVPAREFILKAFFNQK